MPCMPKWPKTCLGAGQRYLTKGHTTSNAAAYTRNKMHVDPTHALAALLLSHHVDFLLRGSLESKRAAVLRRPNIEVHGGVSTSTKTARGTSAPLRSCRRKLRLLALQLNASHHHRRSRVSKGSGRTQEMRAFMPTNNGHIQLRVVLPGPDVC